MDEQVQQMIEKYELAVAFANEFVAEVGKERTHEAIGRAFEKMQVKAGKDLAEELGGNSVEALAGHLQKLAAEKDNLEVVEVTDRQVALRISRCRAWEAFQALGAPELCRLYCDSDHAYIRGYNPGMKLIRTKTIAAGDDCCDHIWARDD